MTSPPLTSYSTMKAESFPSKIRNKTRMPTLATSIQDSAGSPSQYNQARNRNKSQQHQKGRSKIISVYR